MNAADATTHIDVIQWVVKFYSPPDWNHEKTEGYAARLSRYPLPLVAASVNSIIDKMQWMPKLSEWLEFIKPTYNALLERERSKRLLIPHQGEPLQLREALAEAAEEGVSFAKSLSKKWERESKTT